MKSLLTGACLEQVGQMIFHSEFDPKLEWLRIVRCEIGFQGRWAIKAAHNRKWTGDFLEDAWDERWLESQTIELPAPQTDDMFWAIARRVGQYIMMNACWDPREVEWRADP